MPPSPDSGSPDTGADGGDARVDGSGGADTSGSADTAGNTDASIYAPTPRRTGWQETGALALFQSRDFRSLLPPARVADVAADAGAPDAAGPPDELGPGEWIEVSAPIFPKTSRLYQGEGDSYPSTPEGRELLAHESALTFAALLERCAPMDPTIKRRQPGDPPLTEAEIIDNYTAIAECAYREFTVKPYWIPQLVGDVDLCARELGPDWRLIRAEDVERLTEADLALLKDALDTAGAGFGGFYFSLRVFARAGDGSIQEARLEPGVQPRLVPLTFPTESDRPQPLRGRPGPALPAQHRGHRVAAPVRRAGRGSRR